MGEFGTLIGSIALAIVGLAIISVVVGSGNTSSVIQAATGGFAQDLQAATSPVSGGSAASGFNPTSFTNGLHI